jgi:uncharacterized protein (DUF433 family)
MRSEIGCVAGSGQSGDLVFAGTRVPVETLVEYLRVGNRLMTLNGFPFVERWQVEACLDSSPERSSG